MPGERGEMLPRTSAAGRPLLRLSLPVRATQRQHQKRVQIGVAGTRTIRGDDGFDSQQGCAMSDDLEQTLPGERRAGVAVYSDVGAAHLLLVHSLPRSPCRAIFIDRPDALV